MSIDLTDLPASVARSQLEKEIRRRAGQRVRAWVPNLNPKLRRAERPSTQRDMWLWVWLRFRQNDGWLCSILDNYMALRTSITPPYLKFQRA